MGNALDAFRAQREAAEHLQTRLNDVAILLARLRDQVDDLALNRELKVLLCDEQTWLAQAQNTISDVRRWREREMSRYGWALVWRWGVACAFALASTALAGAGYAWVARPYAAEMASLRPRADFADRIERRLLTMAPAERRHFERLMQLPAQSNRE